LAASALDGIATKGLLIGEFEMKKTKQMLSYPSPVHPPCETCAYRNGQNPVLCEAFPNGIPFVILLGIFDHKYPYDLNGISDGGLTYTPKDESSE
jgi:hypothetical protein